MPWNQKLYVHARELEELRDRGDPHWDRPQPEEDQHRVDKDVTDLVQTWRGNRAYKYQDPNKARVEQK